jgi:hypothetical protein
VHPKQDALLPFLLAYLPFLRINFILKKKEKTPNLLMMSWSPIFGRLEEHL